MLSEDCFELLLYLVNTTLMEMDLSDRYLPPLNYVARVRGCQLTLCYCQHRHYHGTRLDARFVDDRSLGRGRARAVAGLYSRPSSVEPAVVLGGAILGCVELGQASSKPLVSHCWWPSADELFKLHRSKDRAASADDEVLVSVDNHLTVTLLESMAARMGHWGVVRSAVLDFIASMCEQCNLAPGVTSILMTKLKSDAFWEVANKKHSHSSSSSSTRKSRTKTRWQEAFKKKDKPPKDTTAPLNPEHKVKDKPPKDKDKPPKDKDKPAKDKDKPPKDKDAPAKDKDKPSKDKDKPPKDKDKPPKDKPKDAPPKDKDKPPKDKPPKDKPKDAPASSAVASTTGSTNSVAQRIQQWEG